MSVAATAAMIHANWLVVHTTDRQISILRLDMMRLPLGILSGIGFIGAGAILRRGEMVRGLTTAATLWLVTVIGLCFGGGQTMLGASVTIIALATLWLMKYVEAVVLLGRRGEISLTLSPEGPEENAVLALLAERGFHMRSRRIELLPDASTNLTCSGRYRGSYPGWSTELVRDLVTQRGVSRVLWEDTDRGIGGPADAHIDPALQFHDFIEQAPDQPRLYRHVRAVQFIKFPDIIDGGHAPIP